jgi:hypothetical protein
LARAATFSVIDGLHQLRLAKVATVQRFLPIVAMPEEFFTQYRV